MSAERLREAARVLRERANDASSWEGVWQVHPDRPGRVIEIKGDGWDDAIVASCIDYSGNENGRRKAAYIATMHPGVGLALADWLDAEADVPYYTPKAYGTADGVTSAAHRLADLILGGTP